MVMFITAAVTIAATRAAVRVGPLSKGPQAPEVALGLNRCPGD